MKARAMGPPAPFPAIPANKRNFPSLPPAQLQHSSRHDLVCRDCPGGGGELCEAVRASPSSATPSFGFLGFLVSSMKGPRGRFLLHLHKHPHTPQTTSARPVSGLTSLRLSTACGQEEGTWMTAREPEGSALHHSPHPRTSCETRPSLQPPSFSEPEFLHP